MRFNKHIDEIEMRFTLKTRLQLPSLTFPLGELQIIKKYIRGGGKGKAPKEFIKLGQDIINNMPIPMGD